MGLKCDYCGKFIGYAEFDRGAISGVEYSYTGDELEFLICAKCNLREKEDKDKK